MNSREATNIFQIRLPVFEGPLELLLQLVKTSEIDIYDIPILIIMKQYTEKFEAANDPNLERTGDFLLLAATLIHLKSSSLLPDNHDDEEQDCDDDELMTMENISELGVFSEVTASMREMEEYSGFMFPRIPLNLDNPIARTMQEDYEFTLYELLNAFQNVMAKSSDKPIRIDRETLTVKEKIDIILTVLEKGKKIQFESLFKDDFSRLSVIVTFLAVLELVMLGLVKVFQEQDFSTIWVTLVND